MESPAAQPRQSIASALAWAAYLGCSWTWVIGMYLPVLLVRDFGWRGWLAFAAPNVVGAAAMGWALTSAGQARRIIAGHRGFVGLFSVVTISFQVFALMWLLPRLIGAGGLLLVFAALACALFPNFAAAIGNRVVALAVWAVSLGAFALLGLGGALELPRETGVSPDWHLVGLIPACALGFLLCPYLDATFLLARARCDRRGARVAFGLGFGVVFLAMIAFSLLYARPLDVGVFSRGPAWVLAIHLAVQVCFTAAAHAAVARGEAGREAGFGPLASGGALLVAVLTAAVLGLAALRADASQFTLLGASLGEVVYRFYMGFYGLLFPAYVLLVMIGRAPARVFYVTCLAALPFFAGAFLLGRMPWAIGGVGLILAVGLPAAVRRRAADRQGFDVVVNP